MKSIEKQVIIDNLKDQIDSFSHFYLTDISGLNAADTSDLRRLCFKQDVKLVVAKNTLLRKALENSGKNAEELYVALKGNTSVMFSETGNVPAKMIQAFRKTHEKPVLKAAFVEESFYIGDNQLEALASIKSKDELLGDLLSLLQSPIKNLLSALSSPGSQLAGAIKTLSEKE